MTGFKSFVDQTELIIQDGLTGIVGPNGCGKSNLLEAIRWVMGENRPTAMRGGGMEDVIFAGAATRTAKNFAEVSVKLFDGLPGMWGAHLKLQARTSELVMFKCFLQMPRRVPIHQH